MQSLLYLIHIACSLTSLRENRALIHGTSSSSSSTSPSSSSFSSSSPVTDAPAVCQSVVPFIKDISTHLFSLFPLQPATQAEIKAVTSINVTLCKLITLLLRSTSPSPALVSSSSSSTTVLASGSANSNKEEGTSAKKRRVSLQQQNTDHDKNSAM